MKKYLFLKLKTINLNTYYVIYYLIYVKTKAKTLIK